ncbi:MULTISPECIES: hypothetical protein [Amycolatopsis]|nr:MULTISPECIES: hypothetical protein [Amycolatopsis]
MFTGGIGGDQPETAEAVAGGLGVLGITGACRGPGNAIRRSAGPSRRFRC